MFPYPVAVIVSIWILLTAGYLIARWRQKAKASYIIPRVFVLCSPRTVQFHYELILRVGLPSYDFNPDKHDVDISLLGQQNNEVVPVTRLNTKTLQDEPLITNLSLIVYRLVEMPALGGIVLKHSGPFRAWLYAYDFTVVDLITNREYYYTLNQYIGALDRVLPLDEPNLNNPVEYPIDDVPLPQWSNEDIFLILFTVINFIIVVVTMMPINCAYTHDLLSVLMAAFGGGMLLFFLVWLLYYHLSWRQDRKEYFNDSPPPTDAGQPPTHRFSCFSETGIRIAIASVAVVLGAASVYLTLPIADWKESVVWGLALLNSIVVVFGMWNIARQLELGYGLINLGLRTRGIEETPVGMHYSEMVSATVRTKSGSNTSDDGISSSGVSGMQSTKTIGRLLGPRSSTKSFGFEPISANKSKVPAARRARIISRIAGRSRLSATGATPNNQPSGLIIHSLPSDANPKLSHNPSDTSSVQPASPRSHLSRLTGSRIDGLEPAQKQKSSTEQQQKLNDSSSKRVEKVVPKQEQPTKTHVVHQSQREKPSPAPKVAEKTSLTAQPSQSLSSSSVSTSGGKPPKQKT